jgi:hypothetical protein
MTVIDAPTTDPTVLDETILDELLPCHHADAGAAWKWTIRCCGKTTYLCGDHDTRGREYMARIVQLPHLCVCSECGHRFGFGPAFSTVYRRNPV